MTRDEWAEVRRIFDAAVERTPPERDMFLDEACAGRAWLRKEIAALLEAHEHAGAFLESSALESAAELLVEDEGGTLLPGRSLGPYVIRGELGRGGMGVVYLADDTRLGRRVALKACGPAQEGRRDRLRHEARAAAALVHPGIATVYALEDIEGDLYLAAEYVPGATLRELMRAGPVEPALVLDIATQLARALAAAHAHGVVHGDLTPANIVRSTAGVVKILDFGVARTTGGTGGGDVAGTKGAPGTPGYMAPEQMRDGAVTFQTDLFAFGVVVYELAAGQHPFAGTSVSREPNDDTLARIPPLSGALAELWPVVARCLRPRASDRYGSAFQLVADVERRQPAAARPRAPEAPLQPRWWWAVHQVAVSLVYVMLMYPVWLARAWLPSPWGGWFLGCVLACATAGTVLRLNLWFTARFYPAELTGQRRAASPWIHVCEGVLALALIAGALVIEASHSGTAVLFIATGVGLIVAAVFVEPLTVRAAFDPSGPHAR